jgi:hypothetical protein
MGIMQISVFSAHSIVFVPKQKTTIGIDDWNNPYVDIVEGYFIVIWLGEDLVDNIITMLGTD